MRPHVGATVSEAPQSTNGPAQALQMGTREVMERLGVKSEALALRAMAVARDLQAVAHLPEAEYHPGPGQDGAEGVPEGAMETLVGVLNAGAPAAKAEVLFKLLDLKGDGLLDADELAKALQMSARHSKVTLTNEQEQHAVRAVMDSARAEAFMTIGSSEQGTPHDGMVQEEQQEDGGVRWRPGLAAMDLEQFRRLLDSHPEVLSLCLPPSLPPEDPNSPWWSRGLRAVRRPVAQLASRVKLLFTTQYGLFLLFIWAILAGNFAWGFTVHLGTFEYYAMGIAWPIARANAYAVRAATGLILLSACHRTLTNLRSTPFRYLIPFDQMLSVHMMLGYVFFVCGATHAISHFFAKYNMASSAHTYLFTEAGLSQPTLGSLYANWPTISGLTLLVTITSLYLFAVRFIKSMNIVKKTLVGKALNNFNYFHTSHQIMWMTVIVLLLVHPLPNKPGVPHTSRTYLFVGIPLIIFLAERLYRLWVRGQPVQVVSMKAMPASADGRGSGAPGLSRPADGATQLVLRVGHARFRAQQRPGQYLYVQCDQVARHEWHPFTITSAPEDEFVTVHVAAKGDWTRKLYSLAQEQQQQEQGKQEAGQPQHDATAADAAAFAAKMRRSSTRGSLGVPVGLDRCSQRSSSNASSGCITGLGGSDTRSADSSLLPTAVATQPAKPLPEAEQQQRAGLGLRGKESGWKEPHQLHVALAMPLDGGGKGGEATVPRIRVDGPYGAPAQTFMDYDVLVLIAGGIGVTPMISILRHLVHQLGVRRCTHCNKVNINVDFWLSKLYFHWIVREQGALQWFSQTLQDISTLDPCDLCDVHIHYTPAGPPGLGNLMLRLAQEVEQEQHNTCLLSGTEMKAKTSFGRPDVHRIITEVALAHPKANVGVMYCGAEELGAQLAKAIKTCGHKSMRLHREVF